VNACTSFRRLYDRNDFPISIMHDAKGNKINWKVKIIIVFHTYIVIVVFTLFIYNNFSSENI